MKSQHMQQKISNSGLRIRTTSGWRLEETDKEIIQGPSMTVPNQGFDINDLFIKNANGLNPVSETAGYYYPDSDIDGLDLEKFNRLDPVDQQSIIRENKLRERTAQLKAEAAQAEIKRKEAEALLQKVASENSKNEAIKAATSGATEAAK